MANRDEATESFEAWVILELMGHRRVSGLLTELELAGHGFLRIAIPETDNGPATIQFYNPASVYAITPVSEDAARAAALWDRPDPSPGWREDAGGREPAGEPPDSDDLIDPDDLPFE